MLFVKSSDPNSYNSDRWGYKADGDSRRECERKSARAARKRCATAAAPVNPINIIVCVPQTGNL